MDEGSGPVVVLLHGIASSPATFVNLFPLLSSRHRLIAIDILGFGKSVADVDTLFTLDNHVAALARTISRLHLRNGYVLVGHSLGSLIAVRYAATRRTKVSRLILISPPIYPPRESLKDAIDRAAEDARLRTFQRLRKYRDMTVSLAQGLQRLPSVAGALALTNENWIAFELSLANAIEDQSTIDDIAATTLPIDIVVGTLDPFVLPAGIRLAAERPNVKVLRIDGADHLVRKSMAMAVADLIDGATDPLERDLRL
jgi:pimeloyl-ACP methyl ester carboxylesterase